MANAGQKSDACHNAWLLLGQRSGAREKALPLVSEFSPLESYKKNPAILYFLQFLYFKELKGKCTFSHSQGAQTSRKVVLPFRRNCIQTSYFTFMDALVGNCRYIFLR